MKPGDRIELIEMVGDPNPILPGSRGTVTRIDHHEFHNQPWGQVSVDWDDGRRLMLCIPPDEVRVISREV